MKNKDIISIMNIELGLDIIRTAKWFRELEKIGAELHLLYEECCNYSTSKFIEEREEILLAEAYCCLNKIKENCSEGKANSLDLYLNTDPRGYPLGIILPSGRSNNMGGIDWRLDI